VLVSQPRGIVHKTKLERCGTLPYWLTSHCSAMIYTFAFVTRASVRTAELIEEVSWAAAGDSGTLAVEPAPLDTPKPENKPPLEVVGLLVELLVNKRPLD
jgi:hypothetical protein